MTDIKEIKLGGYQELALRITQCNMRLEAIERKCGCKVKFKEEIERRLGELEKWQGNQISKSFVKAMKEHDYCGCDEIKVDGVCPEAKEPSIKIYCNPTGEIVNDKEGHPYYICRNCKKQYYAYSSPECNQDKQAEPIGAGHSGACKEGCQCSVAQWERTSANVNPTITIKQEVSVYWINEMDKRMQTYDMDKHDQELYEELKKSLVNESNV